MKSIQPSSESADMPTVVGFEMPGSAASGPQAPLQIMTALLDAVPSKSWTRAFHQVKDQFVADHGLTELRLVGRSISVISDADQLRRLTGDVKALVHRASRVNLLDRVAGRRDVPDESDATSISQPLSPSIAAHPLHKDIESVVGIAGIASILDAVTRATGMRFAAVARVTDARWTACAVYDDIEFGLKPGQDLVLESTFCNEIRQHGNIVTFDHASTNPEYSKHPLPTMYGFESYISVPIYRGNGDFFGTLCALDPEPSRLDDATIRTLEMFARTIGLELGADVPSTT